jgi:GTPase SAR1 family protein
MSAKCAFLGNEDSGKIPLFYTLNTGTESTSDLTTITKKYNELMTTLHLWNVHYENTKSHRGQVRFSKADVFVLCFDVHSPKSFKDVQTQWAPIVRKHLNIPVVLLGIDSLPFHDSVISTKAAKPQEIEALRAEIGAELYISCQILVPDAMDRLFHDLSNVYYKKQRAPPNSGQPLEIDHENCMLLPKYSVHWLFTCCGVCYVE